MATITAVPAKPTIPGEIRWYPMAASQTFKKGEFVYLNTSGLLAVCTADPTSSGIAGMANADALDCAVAANFGGTTTVTTNVLCPITIAKRGQQFTMHVTNAGTATVTAVTNVGRYQYSLFVGTTTTNSSMLHIHYCDTGDTSNRIFVVDAIAPEDVVGDTNGRVIVEVRGVYAQLDSGTS